MWFFGREFTIELSKEEWADIDETLGKKCGLGIPGMPSLFLMSSELIFDLHRVHRYAGPGMFDPAGP